MSHRVRVKNQGAAKSARAPLHPMGIYGLESLKNKGFSTAVKRQKGGLDPTTMLSHRVSIGNEAGGAPKLSLRRYRRKGGFGAPQVRGREAAVSWC